MTQERKPIRMVRVAGDETDFPFHLGNGSVFVLVTEPPQQQGLYLPDGTFKPVADSEPRRMGF